MRYFKKYIPREAYTHLLTSRSQGHLTYENKVDIADGGLHSVLILGPKIGRSLHQPYIVEKHPILHHVQYRRQFMLYISHDLL